MQRLVSVVSRRAPARTAFASLCAKLSTSAAEMGAWGVFPREREGNIYSVNWSLTEDGVVPVGDAFRNARSAVLESKLGAKIEGGKVSVSKPAFNGECAVQEAGADITHGEFVNLLEAQQDHLSSGVEIFVEDAGLGAASANRIGVRVVSDSSAVAMVARNLMIKTPARGVDHRARFDGWNLDPRWIDQPEGHFDADDKWHEVNGPNQESQGERPIVAFVGGPGAHCAIQFSQRKDGAGIVGANVSVGADAPVSAMVEALTEAACGVLNEQQADSVAVPSCALTNGTLVINADDSVTTGAHGAGSLYGAYGNIITPDGVTAMWDGVVGPVPAKAAAHGAAPFVVNGGNTAISLQPDNMSNKPTKIVFFEAGAGKKALSEDEAVERLVDLSDEGKTDAIRSLLKGVKCSTAGSAKDCM